MILPQLSCCGPIEGLASGADPTDVVILPQLSCCGPIEGRPYSRVRRSVLRTFRNYHVAAPLKGGGPEHGLDVGQPSATIMLQPH